MCAALGLYLTFLLLEDMMVGNFSANSTQDQDPDIKSANNNFRKDMLKRKNITKRSIGKQNILLNTSTTSKKPKMWQVGKSTPKQYEIINMLWKKNKILIDKGRNHTTKRTNGIKVPMNNRRIPSSFSARLPSIQTTTSSKIEFYYMDDEQLTINKNYTNTKNTSRLPFLIFHLKGPYVDPIPILSIGYSNSSRYTNELLQSGKRLEEVEALPHKVRFHTDTPTLVSKAVKPTKISKADRLLQTNFRKDIFFDSNASVKRAIPPPPPSPNGLNVATVFNKNHYSNITESSTIHDKIKFFEMYDKYTRIPDTTKDTLQVNHTDGIDDNVERILLENVNQDSHGHDQAKHAKKHITEPMKLNEIPISNTVSKSENLKKENTLKTRHNNTVYFMDENKSGPSNSNIVPSYVNETARWSDYPFTAVYIYEPSQVHCDAAAINTHWLIASGSCLSRVSGKEETPFRLFGESQSAFVAYCGELWWDPKRVAYVKYTVVHPQYHPRDKRRQHLYNIGAIQVVNSMASSCAGWAPAPLMSHQFVANGNVTEATAVGWGLDRFDARYGATDLPKTPLMLYRSVVYFDSCPGNNGYSKAKGLEEGGGVWNVHCLSLPTYNGEDADPVHGGLLLANGKFIAFYLQEERRPWGEQCAQYTGIWRLIPWLMEVAREPEEIDNFMFEL